MTQYTVLYLFQEGRTPDYYRRNVGVLDLKAIKERDQDTADILVLDDENMMMPDESTERTEDDDEADYSHNSDESMILHNTDTNDQHGMSLLFTVTFQ
jgi:hypothetical protein